MITVYVNKFRVAAGPEIVRLECMEESSFSYRDGERAAVVMSRADAIALVRLLDEMLEKSKAGPTTGGIDP